MQVLNNGRIGLGTGSVGGAKKLLDLAIDHVKERRQFGRPLADFELVQDKIGWMVSYLFGLESMCYLTCGLVDAGVPDYSLESAICKVSGTEFLWYAANRALQLAGGEGYMRDRPYEKVLRDTRIYPIFEGANDVMRAFIALGGFKPVGEKLEGLSEIELSDPIRSIGVLVEYASDRIQREVRPDKVTQAHEELSEHADAVSDQVKRLAGVTEKLLRENRKEIIERQFQQKRLADNIADIYAQIAVLSRVSRHLRGPGSRALGPGALHRRHLLQACRGPGREPVRPGRVERRRADDRDREAGLQARLLRLRALRGLGSGRCLWPRLILERLSFSPNTFLSRNGTTVFRNALVFGAAVSGSRWLISGLRLTSIDCRRVVRARRMKLRAPSRTWAPARSVAIA